jgi:hypothetical protein
VRREKQAPARYIFLERWDKGRDSRWIGAVDGLQINSSVYDFELEGVKERRCGGDGLTC